MLEHDDIAPCAVRDVTVLDRPDTGLSLADALALCVLLAGADPKRYERAALRRPQRFIDERLPPLAEVALAASVLAELRHGRRNAGVDTLQRLIHRA